MTTCDLSGLNPSAFEHLANALALRVIGNGHSGFGPGPDGGRDGIFLGTAPYPSATEQWSGRWYLQAKFHAPHLSHDPQKWLLDQISNEIEAFTSETSKRTVPDNWILVTNIDPSGTPNTGAYDRAHKLVSQKLPKLSKRFHIWGGAKVIALLSEHKNVAARFGHFLTPGDVLTKLWQAIEGHQASEETILRYTLVRGIQEQRYAKLEQAGSCADARPGIHRLYIDLPIRTEKGSDDFDAATTLLQNISVDQRLFNEYPKTPGWDHWAIHPTRARAWFVRGGPGHGKSTLGQYVCQVNRAALLLTLNLPNTPAASKALAQEIKKEVSQDLWPTKPRLPIHIELKEYATWYSRQSKDESRGICTYLAQLMRQASEEQVGVPALRRIFSARPTFVVFDGLDEVPSEIKDDLAEQVRVFVEDNEDSDCLVLATSRPQGYSGQFGRLPGVCALDLPPLEPTKALAFADGILHWDRSDEEYQRARSVLEAAMDAPAVRELMTTPLQAHIMGIVVRDGQRPPERKWELYRKFYDVIYAREVSRRLADDGLHSLLADERKLLKEVHSRLGFSLHTKAERAEGAKASLTKLEFRELVDHIVRASKADDIDSLVNTVMHATTDRLVLISTPDSGTEVRFDIRQLQEFFAAELLYTLPLSDFRKHLHLIAGDSHWAEVVHFLLSAIIETDRTDHLNAALRILTELDEGSGGDRTLRHLLAQGGAIASRLLADGVLEHDQRVRGAFTDRIARALSSLDERAISDLATTRGRCSRKWLFDLALHTATERRFDEARAAYQLLWTTVEDGEAHSTATERLFGNLPIPSLSKVVTPPMVTDDGASRLQYWHCRCVFGALSRVSGDEDPETLWPLAEFLDLDSPVVDTYLKESGQQDILRLIASMSGTLQWRTERRECYSIGWPDPTLGAEAKVMLRSLAGQPLPPVWDLAKRVCTVLVDPTPASLVAYFRDTTKRQRGMAEALFGLRVPEPPGGPSDPWLQSLERLSESEFREELRSRGRQGPGRLSVSLDDIPNPEILRASIATLLAEDPRLGLGLLDCLRDRASDRSSTDAFDDLLISEATTNHVFGTHLDAHEWCRLIAQHPTRRADLVRALLHCIRPRHMPMYSRSLKEVHGFPLELPRDLQLLPWVLDIVLTLDGFRGRHSDLTLANATHARRIVSEFVPSISSLWPPVAGVMPDPDIVFVAALHRDGGPDVLYSDCACSLSQSGSLAYVRRLACVGERLRLEDDPCFRSLFSRALESVSGGAFDDWTISTVLDVWRSRSRSPVSTSISPRVAGSSPGLDPLLRVRCPE